MNTKLIYFNNFKYLVSLTGKTQKSVLSDLGYVSDAAVYEWKNGAAPPVKKLPRIAYYFTRALNLPPEILGDGEILLSENIESKVKANMPERGLLAKERGNVYSLNDSKLSGENNPIGLKPDFDELIHLRSLRIIFNNDPDKSTRSAALRWLEKLAEMAVQFRGTEDEYFNGGGEKGSSPDSESIKKP